ncbi:MAG TPA: hypothetical protein VI386_14450 [Candidatus Sulfotelmatobacter sp.]
MLIVLIVAAVPCLAQRGGGHASGGAHGGGFAAHGSFGGHASGSRSFSAMAGSRGNGARAFSDRSFRGRTFSGRTFSGRSMRGRSFPGRLSNRGFNRSHGFRNFRRGFVYPWGYAGYYDPYWWWDSGSSYDEDYERDRAYADQMNQQSLQEQEMRQQRDHELYAQPTSRQNDKAESSAPETVPPTLLVFRDQRKEEVQNYAIVGQTLWNFASKRTEKIPLSEIDLAATARANADRGVDFRLPNSPQGE